MSSFDYVTPVIVNSSEIWLFKWSDEHRNWIPGHPIKQFVELNEDEYTVTSELIPEEQIS